MNILFLAANPVGTNRLRLDEEIRTIDQRLRAAESRNKFNLVQGWAVRPGDLSGHLLRYQPHIVHFSGHGSSRGATTLQDDGFTYGLRDVPLPGRSDQGAKEARTS